MPVVYLIAQPSIARGGSFPKLEPLAVYGEIRVLVQSGEFPTFNPAPCYEKIRERLRDFDPKVDFLAWAGGDTLSAVLAGLVLAEMGIDDFRWLRYERGRDKEDSRKRVDEGSQYWPVDVNLPEPYTDPSQTQLFDEGDEYDGDQRASA